MQSWKEIVGLFAAFLVIVGYIPYIRDTLKKKTLPHAYSWFIWTLETVIIYALQVNAGAGAGSWMNLTIIIISTYIFILSLRNGIGYITKMDTVFLVLSLFSLVLWLVIKQPVLSIILITIVDTLSFIPTVRKSWHKPHSETAFTYELGTVRHGLSMIALQAYNIVTWLNPAAMVFANGLFSLMLEVKKRQINERKN